MTHEAKDQIVTEAAEYIENRKYTYGIRDGMSWLRTMEVERRVRFEGPRIGNLLGDELMSPMALLDTVPDDTDG